MKEGQQQNGSSARYHVSVDSAKQILHGEELYRVPQEEQHSLENGVTSSTSTSPASTHPAVMLERQATLLILKGASVNRVCSSTGYIHDLVHDQVEGRPLWSSSKQCTSNSGFLASAAGACRSAESATAGAKCG